MNVRMGAIQGFGNKKGEIRRDRSITHQVNQPKRLNLNIVNQIKIEDIIRMAENDQIDEHIDEKLALSNGMSMSQPLVRTHSVTLDYSTPAENEFEIHFLEGERKESFELARELSPLTALEFCNHISENE